MGLSANSSRPEEETWLSRRTNRNRTHFGRVPSPRERSREGLLQDWYGSDRARLEVLAHQPTARPIEQVLGEVMSRFARGEAALFEKIRGGWPDMVGADIARHTRVAALRDSVLRIEVSSSTWRYVLEREHRDRILERVQAFSQGTVSRIRFIPPGRQAPDQA